MPVIPAISSRITWMPNSAKTLPFGQRIAHGTMVFSIGVGLTATFINPGGFLLRL
jgi:acyl dehydratase